ncbi:MAG: hypothetical protein IID60_11710 [Proteobacteria bacterium]|nr:hypothetical protein [Pseudomonadota bacterium]
MSTFLKTTILLLTALTMTVTFNTAMAHDCDQQDIIDLGAGVDGFTLLCVENRGLQAQLQIAGLVPGDAYTVWWVYFDDPSQCAAAPECGDVDFGGDDPLAVFGRYGSVVAARNGEAHINDRINGMKPSSGSQIWLLMFGHGAADYSDGRHLARQLLTPEDPLAGAPHLGIVGGPTGFPVAITVHFIE